jgi:hypothetical protein
LGTLGPHWAPFWHPWGPTWLPFGTLGGPLGSLWAPVGSHLAPLGSLQSPKRMPIGAFWDHLGALFGTFFAEGQNSDFAIPSMRNHRFRRLRGSQNVYFSQLFLKPCLGGALVAQNHQKVTPRKGPRAIWGAFWGTVGCLWTPLGPLCEILGAKSAQKGPKRKGGFL